MVRGPEREPSNWAVMEAVELTTGVVAVPIQATYPPDGRRSMIELVLTPPG